jgi:hypothetical protein
VPGVGDGCDRFRRTTGERTFEPGTQNIDYEEFRRVSSTCDDAVAGDCAWGKCPAERSPDVRA